jgi:flagellar protein FlaF
VQKAAESARDIEYRLLGQVTASLIEASREGTKANKRVDALIWNRDIWAAFRLDLSHPENGLPEEIRKQLISLSHWVDKETFQVMEGLSDFETLIDINKNIMAGLKHEDETSLDKQPEA